MFCVQFVPFFGSWSGSTNEGSVGFKVFSKERYSNRNLLIGCYSSGFPKFRDLYDFHGGSFLKEGAGGLTGGWCLDEFITERPSTQQREGESWKQHALITGIPLRDYEGIASNKINGVLIDRDGFDLWVTNPEIKDLYQNPFALSYADSGERYELSLENFKKHYLQNPDSRIRSDAGYWIKFVGKGKEKKQDRLQAFQECLQKSDSRENAILGFKRDDIPLHVSEEVIEDLIERTRNLQNTPN